MSEPTIGRIVHYRLSAQDAERINRRRTDAPSISERMNAEPPLWPAGAQAHIGNRVRAGDIVPMTIVRLWHTPGAYEAGVSCLNGQATLDGSDTLWTLSVKEGDADGDWFWPPRV